MRSRWFRRSEPVDIPLFEGDGPAEPDWPLVNEMPEVEEEVPLGQFDYPHLIRSQERLDEEYAEPLDEVSAGRALRHRADHARALHQSPPEVDFFEGIEIAEQHDPSMQQWVTEHEDRMRQAAILARWDAVKDSRTFALALKVIDATEKARKRIEALRSR